MEIDHQLERLDPQTIADFTDSELTPMQAFWARVNVKAAELDPQSAAYDNEIRKNNPKHQHGFMQRSTKVIYITSEKTPIKSIRGGRVFLAPPLLAAQRIVEGTHRLSTQSEIDGWNDEQKQRIKQAETLAASKMPPAPNVIVNLPESFNRGERNSKEPRAAEIIKQ